MTAPAGSSSIKITRRVKGKSRATIEHSARRDTSRSGKKQEIRERTGQDICKQLLLHENPEKRKRKKLTTRSKI